MARVIIFSRVFPYYHPKAGEPTYFVEKLWQSIGQCFFDQVPGCVLGNFEPKHHTIRSGKRWKAGDKFSPRIWSGKPYTSKQIIIAPNIEIKKVWDIEMDENGIFAINGKYVDDNETLAQNDGLTEIELFHWFMPDYHNPKTFNGQIICWSDDVEY